MKNKNLEKLVIALRSGKYKQTRKCLNRNNDKFCCLGVACEVAIENGVDIKKVLSDKIDNIGNYDGNIGNYDGKIGIYDRNLLFLPNKVKEFFDIPFNSYFEENLIELNDSFDKSFDELADFIELNGDSMTLG